MRTVKCGKRRSGSNVFFSGVIAVRLIVIIGAIKVEVNGKCFQELPFEFYRECTQKRGFRSTHGAGDFWLNLHLNCLHFLFGCTSLFFNDVTMA